MVVYVSVTLSRVGTLGVAPHRYLDVLCSSEVHNFKYYYFANDKEAFDSLADLISKVGNKSAIFHARRFYWDAFLFRYGPKIESVNELLDIMPTEMLRVICEEISNADLVWTGDNDFDGSFGLAAALGLLGIPYVLSFKEARMNQNILTKAAIDKAYRIVVPHKGYLDFFKRKYGIDILGKSIYGDVSWRSKIVYNDLQNKRIKKLSDYDKKIHVCILTDRAIWDKNYPRFLGRYYYVDIINELLRSGFIVHLHVKDIVKSASEPIFSQDNPYIELTKIYKNSFFILNPIDLSKPEGYMDLMTYDLGLVTSGAIVDQDFMEFEQLNIPDTYYEYQMAGVVPIAPKGTLRYMEINCNDVIFFQNPKEILVKLRDTKNIRPKNFFSDIVDLIVRTV